MARGPTKKEQDLQREMNDLRQKAADIAAQEVAYTQEKDKALSEYVAKYDKHLSDLQASLDDTLKKQREGEKINKRRLDFLVAEVNARRQQKKEIKAIEQAMERLRKKTEDVADAAGSFIQGMMGLPSGWEKSLTSTLANVRKGLVKSEEAAKMLSERFEGIFSAQALEYSMVTKLEEALAGYFVMSMAVTMEIDKGTASFEKATSASAAYKDAITDATMANLQFGVTGASMAESLAGIQQRVIDLTSTSGGTGAQIGELGAKMQQLGVETGAFSKLAFTAIRGMHMSEAATKKFALRVADLSKKLKKGLNATIADFNDLMPKLLVHGDKATQVFENLSAMAAKAGISVNTLMGAVGATFDTFEGAAGATQALNAILGGPYLNAIDMVTMSEDQRAKTLVGMFKASGRAYKDLDRYSKKAIMHQLNMTDAAEAEAFFALSMDETNSLLRERAGAAKAQEDLNQRILKATPAMEELKNAFKALAVSLMPAVETMRSMARVITDNIEVAKDLALGLGILTVIGLGYYKLVQFKMMFSLIKLAKSASVAATGLTGLAAGQTAAGTTGGPAAVGIAASGAAATGAAPGYGALGLTIAAVVGSIALLLGGIAALKIAFSDPPDMDSLSRMDPVALDNLGSFMDRLNDDKVGHLEDIADSFERIGAATQKIKPMASSLFGKQVIAKLVGIQEGTAARTAAGSPIAATAAAGVSGPTIINEAKLYVEIAPEMKPTVIGVIRKLVLGDDMNVIVGGGR